MELQDKRPTARGLLTGLLDVPGSVVVTLLAASVGLMMIAVQPVPLLALGIFSAVWAATLVALAGWVAGGTERRSHGPVAH
ncbi:hypothetical protein [Kitasatospora sp. MAP5-34]|uniref:hypothetical protein n=1 Tax=Kitasatospora sp. MAP5-34 TaxID=3035102 RepID=UPI0024767538|nr:hypothetical protein [Kitasatospora sp. MAP5-34]MDH6575671.1 uncharacterized membrane protein YvlD (DUF360 family) [Kitasatospora sp. MAP5-34]